MKIYNNWLTRCLAILLSLIFMITSFPISAYSSVSSSEQPDEKNSISAESRDLAEEITTEPWNLEEDVLFRDKYTKHYIDPDGSRYAVIFPEQVHYYENDSWIEVDNTLSLDKTTSKYVSRNKVFKTHFSQSSDASQLVSIEDGDYVLSWSISFAKKSETKKEAFLESKTEFIQVIANVNALISVNEDHEGSDAIVKSKDTISKLGKAISEVRYNSVFNDINFEEIFINIDSNGGNSLVDHLHGKMPHREIVMDKVFDYLSK